MVARRSLTSSRLVITDYWDFRVVQLEPELVLAPPSPLQSAVLKLQCIWQNKEMSSTVKETCCYLVGHLFCVKFTINYTCSSKRCDKVQWRLFFFFQQRFSEVNGWKVDKRGRGEHLIDLQKSPLRKIKAGPERDHRLQLQQRAAVMEVITCTLMQTESWQFEPQLTPVSLHLEPRAAEQKTYSKGVSQRWGKGHVQEGVGKCTVQSELFI